MPAVLIEDAHERRSPGHPRDPQRGDRDLHGVFSEAPVTLEEQREWLAAPARGRLSRARGPRGGRRGRRTPPTATSVPPGLSHDRRAHGPRGAGARRRGIGRALVVRLLELAREDGRHVMVAGIDAANTPSIALHEQLGFVEVRTHAGDRDEVGPLGRSGAAHARLEAHAAARRYAAPLRLRRPSTLRPRSEVRRPAPPPGRGRRSGGSPRRRRRGRRRTGCARRRASRARPTAAAIARGGPEVVGQQPVAIAPGDRHGRAAQLLGRVEAVLRRRPASVRLQRRRRPQRRAASPRPPRPAAAGVPEGLAEQHPRARARCARAPTSAPSAAAGSGPRAPSESWQ